MGVGLAVVSGVMNGTFTVPMRYLGRWEWENVWALFILISCVILPAGMVGYFSRGALGVLEDVPAVVVGSAIVCGGAWGFGAIMFGQGVSAIGISLGNSLVLGVSASFGSLVPLWVLQPERIGTPKGIGIIFGTVVTLVGCLLCGVAGRRRERERGEGAVERDRMVGRRRPVGAGILLCAGAGMLSAVFNIGYSAAAPLVEAARARGIKLKARSLRYAQRTVTLLKGSRAAATLVGARHIAVSVLTDDGRWNSGEVFQRELARRFPDGVFIVVDERATPELLREAVMRAVAADRVVCAIFTRVTQRKESIGLLPHQATFLRDLIRMGKDPLVVSFGNPYLVNLWRGHRKSLGRPWVRYVPGVVWHKIHYQTQWHIPSITMRGARA
jgi:hypothetical protein